MRLYCVGVSTDGIKAEQEQCLCDILPMSQRKMLTVDVFEELLVCLATVILVDNWPNKDNMSINS